MHGESDSSAVLTSENPVADLPAGYYLIIDTIKDENESGQGHGDAVSDFVVEIAGDKTFSPKATSVPAFDKIIDDTQLPEIEGIEDGGTYDVGLIVKIQDNETLFIDGVNVESPYAFNTKGEHTITVSDDNGNSITKSIKIVQSPMYETAPDDAYNDWDYTIDEVNKEIVLARYVGLDTDVIVYGSYIINGVNYHTRIANYAYDMGEKYMFGGNKNINSVEFGSNINTLQTTHMNMMFVDCTALKKIDMSRLDMQNALNLNNMFHGCTALTEVNLNGIDVGSVKDMGGLFSGCTSLTSLDLSGFDTSNVTYMNGMFSGCIALTDLNVKSFNTKNVSTMDSMFTGCKMLKNLDLSSFDTSNVGAMKYMFYNCLELETLDLRNFCIMGQVDMRYMFQLDSKLKQIYVTSGKWDTSNAYTEKMFSGCGTSSVTYVDASAMSNVHNVDTILFNVLPLSMASEEDLHKYSLEANDDTTVNYGIGDSVPFKLTAVMPDSISAYETYKLVFHDSMTDGLTYDEGSLKVFVGDTEIPAENYTVASDDGMKSFTVTINDAKVEPFNAVAGTEVSVKYSATLNDGAVFRNVNNAYLEYSNNPNGEGTGTTISDDVTAFTFELNIDKVDKDGNELAGAGFTLYKKAEDGYVQFGNEITGGTNFSFSGLAVGDYKLVESTTPDGYNTMADLEFSVVADSMEDADGNAYVTGLKIVAQGGTLDSDMIEGWIADTDTGMLSADIANYKGSELPSTGGMGTVMFYLAGGCIIATVCFVLVMRRRKQAV